MDIKRPDVAPHTVTYIANGRDLSHHRGEQKMYRNRNVTHT